MEVAERRKKWSEGEVEKLEKRRKGYFGFVSVVILLQRRTGSHTLHRDQKRENKQ